MEEKAEFRFVPCPVPIGEDGFAKSFSLEEPEELKGFFEKHGVVVVREVLSEEECEKSVTEMWAFMKEHYNEDVDQNDPSTWGWRWPEMSKMGLLGGGIIRALGPQACENRQNPKVHKAFSIVFGTPELITSVSRWGMMRPTKGVRFPGEEVPKDKPEWKTVSEWVHIDMNPYSGKCSTYGLVKNPEHDNDNSWEVLKVQGVLAVADCSEKEGGFHCISGFQTQIRDWEKVNRGRCKTADESLDPLTVQIAKDDEMREHVQKIPLRKGSIVIWNSFLPHGNFPNESDKPRQVQYIKMHRADDPSVLPFKPQSDTEILTETSPNGFDPNFQMTELGKKIYGVEPWPTSHWAKRGSICLIC